MSLLPNILSQLKTQVLTDNSGGGTGHSSPSVDLTLAYSSPSDRSVDFSSSVS